MKISDELKEHSKETDLCPEVSSPEVPARRKQLLDTLVMTAHAVIVAESLSPKSGVNAGDNLLNKSARQRQQWPGGECSNNGQ